MAFETVGAVENIFAPKVIDANIQNTRVLIMDEWYKVKEELQILGRRDKTIFDYEYHLKRYCKVNNIKYIDEINRESVIKYLGYGETATVSRNNRLKKLKSVFNRFYERDLIKTRFWKNMRIKVDKKVKKGVSKEQVYELLSCLDFAKFAHFRDATAILMLWETGIRIGTLGQLTVDMLDLDKLLIHFDGRVMKNHNGVTLPISERLAKMLEVLMVNNQNVLNNIGKKSDYVFITERGNPIMNTDGNNSVLAKRLNDYCERFELKPFGCHDIRRGFAKDLLDKGLSLPIISKALNHSDLSVTSKYLYVDNKEVIDALRKVKG